MDKNSKRQILAQLVAINNKLVQLYGTAYAKTINLPGVIKAVEAGEDDFDWDKHPDLKKQVEKVMSDLTAKVSALIGQNADKAYDKSKADATKAIVKSVGGHDGKELSKGAQQVMDEATEGHRERAKSASEKRKLEISDRVWNYNDNAKVEIQIIIQNGIKQGQSAADMTASLKKYLNNPEALFRRVRNKETGDLELSEAAKNYHPGRGVYRSAYKNALRLARTEINMAYREAEWNTYQDNPLIKAYEIRLSNNHTTLIKGEPEPLHDICDELAGVYPKQFKWTGWHPQCRCMMLPVTLSTKEFGEYVKAKREGRLAQWMLNQPTVEMPKNFMDWIEDNKGRISAAMANGGAVPYFIRDNFKDGDVNLGLAFELINDAERFRLQVEARHAARTKEQIEDIKKRWAEHKEREQAIKKIQAESDVPYYAGRFADDIDKCSTIAELDAFMVKSGVAKSTSFGKMSLEDAKQVCKVAAEMQSRFTLRPIDLKVGGTARSHWYMRANGSHVEMNSGFWRADKIAETLRSGFYDSVSNYVNRKKKDLADWEMWAKKWQDKADEYKAKGDKANEKRYLKEKRKADKEIKRLESLINSGVNRFNQFLSRETMLRDCFAHEMGHVVHDQVTGGINGAHFMRQRYNSFDASRMNSELRSLYDKYKGGDRFVTEYGMSSRNEFLSESMVLYMYRQDKLPQDVHDWFVKLEKMAHGGVIPKKSMSYQDAYQKYKSESDWRVQIKKNAEKRHAARTQAEIDDIQNRWNDHREREKIFANAKKRHDARTDEQRQEIIDKRNAELSRFALWEKAIRDTETRAKTYDWLTDEEKTLWVDGSNGTKIHLQEGYNNARVLNKRMDVIDALRPDWNKAAMHQSVFNVYRDKLDEAKRLITGGFKQNASDVIRLLNGIESIEPLYVDLRAYQKNHPGKGGKKSKIELALDEVDEMIEIGDIGGARLKIAEAEKTRKINEASAQSKAEAAKRKKEEAERKKNEAAEKKGKVLRHKDCETIDDFRELYGDDMPAISVNLEQSVKRNTYTDPKYLANRDEIERKLKEFWESVDFSHCTDSYNLEGYLKNGILTNLQRDGDTNSGYNGRRRSWGHFGFDLPGNPGVTLGPVDKRYHLKPGEYYRCGVPCSKDPYEAYVRDNSGYGDAQLVFREDRVITTFTMGNSLGERTIPSLTSDPKVCSLDKKTVRHIDDSKYTIESLREGNHYCEVQYLPLKSQGNFTPRDFKRIVLGSHPERSFPKSMWEKWAEQGVDIYYIDRGSGKAVLYMKGKPLITNKEAKIKLDGMRQDLENMFQNEAAFSNKDISVGVIRDKIKNGDYIGALEDLEKYNSINNRKKSLEGLIPDVDRWHKQFSIDDLEAAHKAITAKIDFMDNTFKVRNSPDDVLRKWDDEITKLESAKKFPTWEIAKQAYVRRKNELVYEYHKTAIDNDLDVLRGFKTKNKEFAEVMRELESKVANKEWSDVEVMISSAKDVMKNLGDRVLRLGDSHAVKFTAEQFEQAQKDAAKWFKDPNVLKAYKEADDYMSKYAQEMWKKLSDEEKHVLWMYSDGSRYINEEMLGTYSLKCISPIDGTVRNGLADANVLTNIIENAPALKESMWMQSGKSADAFRSMFGVDIRSVRDLSTLLGKEGVNQIFSSCHASADGHFVKGGSTGVANDVVMNIYMPAGTKGVYMEPFASYGDNLRWKKGIQWTGTKRREAPSDQVEFLLQRGAKFKIKNAYQKDGKWYVDVDLIEQTAVDALDTYIPNLNNRWARTSQKPTLI